jgi:CRISPR-associated exonuclease Cas4
MHAFREVATAAYCPRKLYYRRRDPEDGTEIPAAVAERRRVAFRYDELLASDDRIREAPVAVSPTTFRSNLGCARARLATGAWEGIVDPDGRDVRLAGKDCRGVAHKRFAGPTGPTLSLVFTGEPPAEGVWHPQSVRLVAAAAALAWERETTVERVYAEYPTHGVVRGVDLGTRRRAEYREALRVAESVDGPPARVDNDAKCDPCEFADECGVRTRSLRSLLGG